MIPSSCYSSPASSIALNACLLLHVSPYGHTCTYAPKSWSIVYNDCCCQYEYVVVVVVGGGGNVCGLIRLFGFYPAVVFRYVN